ncbi:MAG: hypothetical protein LBI33_12495 [Propionibacteriaceae bacterium]|jgi:hypothetical protein|nr:hypothetical protein [Propionibacteriaceae bacterium]
MDPTKPNGAAILEFIASWPGGAFDDDFDEVLESFREPNPRDEERMAWLDDYLAVDGDSPFEAESDNLIP